MTLKNGMNVTFSSFVATILKINAPDRKGNFKDCVLWFESKSKYDRDINYNPYFGATVGRVDIRINDSKFIIDGIETQLD